MTTPYERSFPITTAVTDRFGRLKASQILSCIQEVSGDHSALLGFSTQALTQRNLFWAVLRHRVQITRLPTAGETVTVKTWPLPTTRTAYPRSAVFYDAQGRECIRAISLWVLMDRSTRAMVLPGKSGVEVEGLLLGSELAVPGSLVPRELENQDLRRVRFSDLDQNGHMNNCRYLDWCADLLPEEFHRQRSLAGFTICYLSEAREGEQLQLSWSVEDGPVITVNSLRTDPELSAGHSRVFAAQLLF